MLTLQLARSPGGPLRWRGVLWGRTQGKFVFGETEPRELASLLAGVVVTGVTCGIFMKGFQAKELPRKAGPREGVPTGTGAWRPEDAQAWAQHREEGSRESGSLGPEPRGGWTDEWMAGRGRPVCQL